MNRSQPNEVNAHAQTQPDSAPVDRRRFAPGIRAARDAGVAAVWVLVFLAWLAAPARGEPAADAPARRASNRYLLAVETSKPMQRRTEGTFKAVQELVQGGMVGQMRRGDSLGLWTWNSDVYTGRFPLQQWTEETRKDIAARVYSFLSAQKFERTPDFAKILPTLQGVLESSEYLTVVLVVSGESAVSETGFDQQINDYFKANRKEQQSARQPFIIVLRGERGRWVSHAISSAPWMPEMPAMPIELIAAGSEAGTSKPAAPAIPPLILSGGSSKPAPKPGLPTEVRLAPDGSIVAVTNSNLPRPVPEKVPSPAVPVAAAAAVPATPAVATTNLPPKLEPEPEKVVPSPAPTPQPGPVALTNLPVEIKAPAPAPIEPLPIPIPTPAPAIIVTQAPVPAPPRLLPAPTPTPAPANIVTQAPLPAPPRLLPAPAPANIATQAAAPVVKTNRVAPPLPAAATPAAAVPARATAPRPWYLWPLVFGAGGVLICFLVVLRIRRKRARKRLHISLITESFDKTRH